MSGLLGMNEEKQKLLNMRATSQTQTFPLKKPDINEMSMYSPPKFSNLKYSPDKETDISNNQYGRTFDSSYNEGRNTQFTLNSTLSARNNRVS